MSTFNAYNTIIKNKLTSIESDNRIKFLRALRGDKSEMCQAVFCKRFPDFVDFLYANYSDKSNKREIIHRKIQAVFSV